MVFAANNEEEAPIRLSQQPTSASSAAHRLPSTTGPGSARDPVSEFSPGKSYREIRTDFEAEFERRYVSWLLDRHAGNISAAAREAKMDRKHLYDLARKHGLRGDRG